MISATIVLAALLAQSSENTWTDLGQLSVGVSQSIGAGSQLFAMDADTLYLAPSNRNRLVRYSVKTNTWIQDTAALPTIIDYSTAIARRPGTPILVFMQYFNLQHQVVEYDTSVAGGFVTAPTPMPTGEAVPIMAVTATDTYVVVRDSGGSYLYAGGAGNWTRKAQYPGYAASSTPGLTMVAPGGNFLYTTLPGNPNNFYRYAIAAAPGQFADSWTPMAPVPLDLGNMSGVGNGASMAAGLGGTLLLLPGDGDYNSARNLFLSYDIPTNTWSQLAPTPASNSAGSSLAPLPADSALPCVFATRGAYTKSFWRYERARLAPDAPVPAGQFEAFDGTTPLQTDAGIAFTAGDAVVIKAAVSHRESESVALEVEAKPVGAAFNETGLVQGASVPSGGTASVTLNSLTFGGWHWRVRSVTPAGKKSAWVSFGTNGDPNGVDVDIRINVAPISVAIQHVRVSTGATVGSGETVIGSEDVTFRAPIVDPNGDAGRLEIEIRAGGVAFRGEATARGPQVPSGQLSGVTPFLAPGSYHWQGRMVDQRGLANAWTASADFTVLPSGSTNAPSCFSATTGASGLLLVPVIALLALARSRR